MKKNVLIFAALICMIGCKKKEETASMPTSSAPEFHFVKYWRADTFRNNQLNPPHTDSFTSFKHGDTSGIVYHGTVLYLFSKINSYGVADTTKGTTICYYSPIAFDTAAAWSTGYIYPYKYWHIGDAQYKTQLQAATITTRSPHFLVTGDAWYWGRP